MQELKTTKNKTSRLFTKHQWYKAAILIIIWAILQEMIMASSDIIDNIFVNFLHEDHVDGLKDLRHFIQINWVDGVKNPEWLNQANISLNYFGDKLMYDAGQIAVNGVTASNQLYVIMFVSISGFCYGCGVYSSQYFGSGDHEKLRKVTTIKIYVVFAITSLFAIFAIPGIIDGLIGFTTQPTPASWQDGTPVTQNNVKQLFDYIQYRAAVLSTQQGIQYYQIIGPTYILFTINEVAITTLRETKRVFYAFWMSIISLAANVVMNVFLTSPTFLGNFHGLGVQGTALATVLGRVLQTLFIIGLLSWKRFEFIPHWSSFKVEKPILMKTMHKAAPLLFNEILFSVGLMIQVKLRGSYSLDALTANAMFATITGVIFSPLYHGINAGITTFVGNDLGANKIEQAKQNSKHLIFIGLVIALLAGALLAGLSFVIPGVLFSNSVAEAQRIAIWMIFIYSLFYIFVMTSNIFYSVLRAGGKVWWSLAIDSIFTWTITIPVLAILISLNGSGIMPLDIIYIHLIVCSLEVFKVFIGFMFYKKGNWAQNLTIDQESEKNNWLKLFTAKVKKPIKKKTIKN
ncbi:MATE family efflux transporter [Williamsoniiplasma lucivorax]|uniref:Probable multidrug resistance protein NorM n=1 Tax=Williamsoniiplasma lucivorax TaxID=209274 RepID=A0A2S5RFP2_9MOLU|nr:MATE family efflux transporter [Williamsoniiplasma lucivorax]PPE06120.1 MATE efflux family protein [Williamsoniiplasma lucivorax]